MSIDATGLHWNLQNLRKDANVLTWTFNAATAADMATLGRTFAEVIGAHGDRTMRIGLVGSIGNGKSTFVAGILDAFADRVVVEAPPVANKQAVWRSVRAGWVRHYDTAIGGPYYEGEELPSYAKNDVGKYTPSRVDLVEHPASDRHDKAFDFLIGIRRDRETDRREVTVIAPPDAAASPGFQKFLEEAEPFKPLPAAAPI